MNAMQLFLLMQNQGMVLRSGMTITSPTKGLGRVKREFKKMMGLKPKCSDEVTLQAIGSLYAMNGQAETFNEYITNRGLIESHGMKLVVDEVTHETEEMED